ncbi:hypothetical protein I317_05456 [Kwoniella heveanensis CBS 569]|nr:hypothetical protein I317_05456 [Kwoniella heveanensis CBS 569]
MAQQPFLTGKSHLNLPAYDGQPIKRIDTKFFPKHKAYADIYYETEALLKDKGWSWPYLLSDFIVILQTLPEGDAMADWFWNHFFTVYTKRDLFPKVIKDMPPAMRQEQLRKGREMEMSHIWDDQYSYPGCLHDLGLPILAPAHMNSWDPMNVRPAPVQAADELIQAPDMLWNLLYLATKRVISSQPLHGRDKHAKRHATEIPGLGGATERSTFGSRLAHGTADGVCKNGACNIRTTSILMQELILLGKDHCAAKKSVRYSDVVDEEGWTPPIVNPGSGWTLYHGIARLSKTGTARNALSIELATYKALKSMIDRDETNYDMLPELNANQLDHVQFAPLEGADRYV